MIGNKLIVFVCSMGLVALFLVAVFNVSFLKARFIDEFNSTQLKPPVGLHTNSLNMRVGIYLCSWRIFSDHWMIGTGIGDAQHELNNCYDSFDTHAYREVDYNTHNNFFWVAVSTGSIGLGLFLWMLIFHGVRATRYNNVTFLLFITFCVICFLGENILSRHHGVVFYSLFCSLFARQNLQLEKLP